MHGLFPRKGAIAVGSDADLVVFDPTRSVTIKPDQLHSAADYCLYTGHAVQGWPALTIVAGEVLVREGVIQRGPGRARFLSRPPVAGRVAERLRCPDGECRSARLGTAGRLA